MNRRKKDRSQESGFRSQKAETTSTTKGTKGAKVELLPCPFCGNKAKQVLYRFTTGPDWMTQCSRRGSTCPVKATAHASTSVESASKWNTRVSLRASAPLRDKEFAGKRQGTVMVRQHSGTCIATVKIGTTTYGLKTKCGEDQAAKALASKVQRDRVAERVTLSFGTPGADTGPEFAGETHYLLTVFEGAEGGEG